MALVTTLSTARWMPSGSKTSSGIGSPGRHSNSTCILGRPDAHQLDTSATTALRLARHEVGLALLAEGEHVHHQGRDAVLVPLDDVPALAE